MDITNKSRRPLNLPLPGGKKLFLAPGKTGQVSPQALDHPMLVKLLEAGDIVTNTHAPKSRDGGSGHVGPHPGSRQGSATGTHRSGDR